MFAVRSEAAFLIQIDTDGLDDGVLTYNSHFTFGGDTTTASQSAPSTAYGLSAADSIFGGDGVAEPDTYVYRYNPTSDADNLATAGIELGVDWQATLSSAAGSRAARQALTECMRPGRPQRTSAVD